MKIFMSGNTFPMAKTMAYGGERMILYLIEELVKLGHDVYCFIKEGCDFTGIDIKDYIPLPPLRGDIDITYEAVKEYIKKTGIEPDLYNCSYFGEGWDSEIIEKFNYAEITWCRWPHAPWQLKKKGFNTISYSRILQLDFAQVGIPTIMIHHGIPKNLYQFEPEHDDYAVWIGKIEAGKAPRLAIELAKAAGLKIVLMGPPYSTTCFYNEVAPYIDNEKVFWLRGVNDEQKRKIMSKAKVFISSNCNIWKEHLGLVNIEALAMGVPIIGFNRINQDCAIKVDGIVFDGKQGFLLEYNNSNNLQEILDKGVPLLNMIDLIDREDCRKHFEKYFTAELMGLRYDWLYKEIAQGKRFETVEIPI